MCNCSGHCFDQLGISYTFCLSYSFAFDDCRYSSDHEIFVLRCKQNSCPYNMSGFLGSYISLICCGCAELDQDRICIHCKRLRNSLNNDTIKVCLKKEDMPQDLSL